MIKIKTLALTVSVLALTACSGVPIVDKDLPKPMDMASSWSSLVKDGVGSSAVRDGWLYEMNMPELNSFIDDVLKNSPNIKAVSHRMVAAGYDARAAGAGFYPSLGASYSATKSKNKDVSHSLGLDARWELDVWGKLASSSNAADASYEEAMNNLQNARFSLVAQAAQAWFDAIAAEQQLELARRTVSSYEGTYKIVHNRYLRGLIKGLDLRQAISVLEEAKSTLSFRDAELGRIKRQLEILSGHYPAAAIKIAGRLPDEMIEVPAGLPLEILERRPDLRAAKARLYASGYRSDSSYKSLLPSLSITARGSNTTEFFGDLLKFDNVFWNLIGNITQPIFQGGRLLNTAKASEARFEAEKQEYARTLLKAFKEVEDALQNDSSYTKRVTHTSKAAENAMAAEDVALDQYSRGLIPISTVLNTHRQSLQQQGSLIRIKNDRINNRIRLHLALGGSFEKTQGEENQTQEIGL
jgi:NodT family efflux transporter outer membrane factor (OMF) lipoprotein